jgi:CheY-like chemotaxis protein
LRWPKNITAVENGRAALALIESGKRFALMIVDYAMPGINGAEVIARAREICPQLRAILLTGYADRGLSLPPDVPVLRKPFRTDELREHVWSTIASGDREALR